MPKEIRQPSITAFKNTMWNHYRHNGRSLPWRKTRSPYRIFVSEVMLQQTQVSRVEKKYREFLKAFPSFKALANAPQADVLRAWQGLGYNRRALNLHRAARTITNEYNARIPKETDALVSLPGIGEATAGSLQAFVHEIPAVFIETNIRSVFIHFFFPDQGGVTDRAILPLVEQTVDQKNPREWYYALMDYGVFLKESGNPNIRSAHYTRQTPFRGSNREIRSAILKYVLSVKKATKQEILQLPFPQKALRKNLASLAQEGFITVSSETVKPLS